MTQAEWIDERCCSPCRTMRETAERELRDLSATALLAEAEAAGIRLTLVDERLLIRGPRSAEMLVRLRLARKSEVLAILVSPCQQTVETGRPTDSQAVCVVSACADPAVWDIERAPAVIAEVDAPAE